MPSVFSTRVKFLPSPILDRPILKFEIFCRVRVEFDNRSIYLSVLMSKNVFTCFYFSANRFEFNIELIIPVLIVYRSQNLRYARITHN